MDFCDILKALRTINNLSQKALGEIMGLTVSTVCDWEKKRSEPNLAQLSLLADVFSVSTDFLLGRKEESS